MKLTEIKYKDKIIKVEFKNIEDYAVYYYNHNKLVIRKGLSKRILGKTLFVSGQISIDHDGNLIKGKVGRDLNTDEAYKAAERCGLSIVAQVKKACNGDLSKVKSCIKLTGFVNSTEDYIEQPKVINGASDLVASRIDVTLGNFFSPNKYLLIPSTVALEDVG